MMHGFLEAIKLQLSEIPLVILLMLTMLLPYHENNFRVTMTDPITTETQQVTIELENRTNREIWHRYTAPYYEQKTENGWLRINSRSQLYMTDGFAFGLRPWGKERFTFSPKESFELPMEPGTYRFVLRYCLDEDDLNQPGGTTASVFCYEFQVAES